MIFKNKKYTRTVIKNNILRIYNSCSDADKFDWYKEANIRAGFLAKKYNIDKNKCIGIISALSPLKTWEQNLLCAESFINSGKSKHMKQFENKAKLIKLCSGSDDDILKILSGNKIQSFYLNIKYYNKNTNVTIDRHALSIALNVKINNDMYIGMTKKQYQFFVDCYIYAANKINISPLLLQSSTWVYLRKLKLKTGEKIN